MEAAIIILLSILVSISVASFITVRRMEQAQSTLLHAVVMLLQLEERRVQKDFERNLKDLATGARA